ncbi:(Fe-S)-binding protein [Odoribacter lunatus]|uniref:(Fe-S)-binding protein n=1 Tax=Odoribacter lunatus TaxID=2941335 RepID=UPI00203BC193|nr:(Fe-S)-binding protein [Odoribacter lunatus]
MFSVKTFKAIKEVFLECLVHHKIYRTNPFLGYMHMCFGLGWFLLIIMGKIESTVYHTTAFNPPYFAIFFRFFHPANETFPYSNVFAFLMDLILLFILSGLLLAFTKRIYSKALGLKKTTNHRPFDLLILTVLWLIFPLRFLAESFTSGIRGGGSFLTHTAGDFFSRFLPLDTLSYPAWWAYSSVLGLFFILLPFSRYMHIPTEIVYIFLKNWGVKQGKEFNAFSNIQLYSCSRCGICIDRCQLNTSLGMQDTQPVYFLKKIRHHRDYSVQTENCLMCGRCEAACPVDLKLNALRLSKRQDRTRITKDTYSYIQPGPNGESKVAYFAGCMGHLTPSVIRSMQYLFKQAHVDYTFIDEQKGICCGRPLLLSGNRSAATVIMEKNKAAIEASGATLLVTSCPICYKTFKEDYQLNIPVMHHSEYIHMLIKNRHLSPRQAEYTTVFHNPCELGRGANVYTAPESVLKAVSHKIAIRYDSKNSLCCGGSLANIHITAPQRTTIATDTVNAYAAYNPDYIVTACPLCKKTFTKKSSAIPIKDIAEIVAENC